MRTVKLGFGLLLLAVASIAFGQANPGGNTYVPFPPTNITSPANNQCLVYQSSSARWVNGSCSSGGGVTVTGSPANGNLSFFSGAGTISNGNLSGDCSTSGSGVLTCTKINGTAFSGLSTGILKNTTGTGVPSIAVAGTDYQAPITAYSQLPTIASGTLLGNSSGSTAAPSALTNFSAVAPTVFNVFNYGALCTGSSHDDTAAFQAAINAAAASNGTSFWGQSVSTVYVPGASCWLTSVTLPARVSLRGDGVGQTVLNQLAAATTDMIIVPPESTTYPSNPSQWNKSSLAQISGFSMFGNSSATASLNGISFPDSASASIAGWLHDLYIVAFNGNGIYGGVNRGEGNIDHVISVSNIGDGLDIGGYDWYVANSQFGSNNGYGINQIADGCTMVTNADIYSNFLDNLYLSSSAGCFFYIANSSLDRAKHSGLHIASNHVQFVLQNSHFADNSAAANATYPHVLLDNANGSSITLTGVGFSANDAGYSNVANYLIQEITSTPTVFVEALSVSASAYVTAQFSNPTAIIGTVNGANFVGNFTSLGTSSFGNSASQDFWQLSGQTAGSGANMSVASSAANANGLISALGNGQLNLQNGDGLQFQVGDGGATTVNFAYAKGSATGGSPLVGSFGTDTNINYTLHGKGTGQIIAANDKGTLAKIIANGSGTQANSVGLESGATGVAPQIFPIGDANASINLRAAGTGIVQIGASESLGTKFTTSGCSISSTTSGPAAGTFTLGANSCTVIVTINGATGTSAANGWTCQAHDRTAPTVLIGGESSSTTTTASITIPAGAGATDVISFSCTGY